MMRYDYNNNTRILHVAHVLKNCGDSFPLLPTEMNLWPQNHATVAKLLATGWGLPAPRSRADFSHTVIRLVHRMSEARSRPMLFFGGGGMASRRVSCPDACVCVAYTRMCVQYTHIASIHKSINSICIHTYRFHTVEPQRSLSGR